MISVTKEELVAAFQLWWDEYKDNKETFVDYDADDYNDATYASDSAFALITRINKVKGE